jgi:hypothetical protein
MSDMNSKRKREFINFETEMEADIHIIYGYRISIMIENVNNTI